MKSLRLYLYLLIGLLLGASWSLSYAGSVALKPPVGVIGNAASASGWTTASNFVGTFSASSFNASFTTQVAGKAVTVPASWRLASNAGQFAMGAVRLNPVGLIGGAVAAYLLTKGIQWIDGQWQEDGDTLPATVYYPTSEMTADCNARCASQNGGTGCNMSPVVVQWAGPGNNTGRDLRPWYGEQGMVCIFGGADITGYGPGLRCPINYTLNGTQCVGTARPASQEKWDAAAQQLPDPVATELAPKIPLPLQPPVPDTTPQDIPVSDPKIDPQTGKPYRDVIRVTPSPDGGTVDVQPYKQPLNPDGSPAVDPVSGTPAPATSDSDLCKNNPGILACLQLDEVPDTTIPPQDNPFSLNPVSGFGADNASCPASVHLFNKGGQSIDWSWSQFCTFSQGIRPLVIGFAWLAAIAMVVSVGRRSS